VSEGVPVISYTSVQRDQLLAALLREARDAGWSTSYLYEHVRAVARVPLGTDVDVEVREYDDSVGQDLYLDEHDPADVRDDGRDVERVAFQLDYYGLR
jgi:hypothetical protein